MMFFKTNKTRVSRGFCILQTGWVKKIGVIGFEPTAPSSRTKCATRLRYIPIFVLKRQD